MRSPRRDGDGARAAFAAWLNETPRPTADDFARLRAANPAIQAELDRLWRDLARYEATITSVAAEAPRRRPRSRTVARAAIVAAVVLFCAGAFVASRAIQSRLDRHRAEVDEASALVLKAREFWRAPPKALVDAAAARAAVAANDEVARAAALLETVRAAQLVTPATRARCDVLASEIAVVKQSAAALAVVAKLDPLASRDLERQVASAIATVEATVTVRIRSIDLDDGGADVAAVELFGQSVRWPDCALDSPRRLPLVDGAIVVEPGEWRITVVDRAGGRFSELRLLAIPGVDLGLVPAFLRETAKVTGTMARVPAATFPYGVPEDEYAQLPPSTRETTIPAAPATVGEFFVDPCETTKGEWAAFWHDLDRHPGWCGGLNPVPRPSWLAADGTCPDPLRRHPVTDISWVDATLYADWAGKRLATNVEWERVAKGPHGHRFPWGDNYVSGTVDGTRGRITVGRVMPMSIDDGSHVDVDDPLYAPGDAVLENGARIHRLADSVTEFVEDLAFERHPDGTWTTGDLIMRVSRGASWRWAGQNSGTMTTSSATPQTYRVRMSVHGLRCAKSAAPPPAK